MMISKYQALYERDYTRTNPFSGELVRASLIDVIPGKVDGQWHHSWHWPDPQKNWNEYISRVKESIATEKQIANRKLENLNWAEQMINQLEPTP